MERRADILTEKINPSIQSLIYGVSIVTLFNVPLKNLFFFLKIKLLSGPAFNQVLYGILIPKSVNISSKKEDNPKRRQKD